MTTNDSTETLSRKVAEVAYQGWTIVKCEKCWEVRDSNGELKNWYPLGWAEDTIWMSLKRKLQNVDTDVNVALTLTVENARLELIQSYQGWVANYELRIEGKKNRKNFGASDANPAKAICRARVALAEAIATAPTGDAGEVG